MRGFECRLLLLALCFFVSVGAQAPVCPDSVAMERCLQQFDRNHDNELDMDELVSALDSVSWYARWTLSNPEKYMKRCDADKSNTISGMELLSSSCLSTCVEQRQLYMAMC